MNCVFADNGVNELILGVRLGNERACASLLSLFEPLISSEVGRFAHNSSYFERESIAQDARLALINAAKTYDVNNGEVTFGLYAKICVRRKLISVLRKQKKDINICSLDEIGTAHEDFAQSRDHLIENEEAENIYRTIKETLSGYELDVFNLYIDGYSVSQISSALNRPEKSVENAVQRFTVKLKGFLK